jgi:hypothetical protein
MTTMEPEAVAVPCPRCEGTIEVVGTVVGARLLLRGGGTCESCGLTVVTASDVPVES